MLCYAHGLGCGERRIHHESPEVSRGGQFVDVKDGHEGPVFCSITCAILAGFMTLRYDKATVCQNCLPAHINHGPRWICTKGKK